MHQTDQTGRNLKQYILLNGHITLTTFSFHHTFYVDSASVHFQQKRTPDCASNNF